MDTKDCKDVTFEEIKEEIREKLNKILAGDEYPKSKYAILGNEIIRIPSFEEAHTCYPAIAVVCQETGRIHTFLLFSLVSREYIKKKREEKKKEEEIIEKKKVISFDFFKKILKNKEKK
jgi:hypothetical protein